MFNAANLPLTVPVFPLPGALLLPRVRLPLHIFEPRFLVMLDDVLKTRHRLIAMVQPCSTSDGSEKLHDIGCAGRVTAFSETEDNRYMISLTGVSRFRTVEELQSFAPYRKFSVAWGEFDRDLGAVEQDADLDRDRLFPLLDRFFKHQEQAPDLKSLRKANDEMLVNSLSMLCPFGTEDKQALLEAPSLTERCEVLVKLLEYALRGGSPQEVMQ